MTFFTLKLTLSQTEKPPSIQLKHTFGQSFFCSAGRMFQKIKNCRVSNYVYCWKVELDKKYFAIMPAHCLIYKPKDGNVALSNFAEIVNANVVNQKLKEAKHVCSGKRFAQSNSFMPTRGTHQWSFLLPPALRLKR